MKSRSWVFLLLPICILSLWAHPGSSEQSFTPGFVVEVFDGDTIRVSLPDGKTETVRYIGMDTPETHHPHKGVEELGIEAGKINSELVLHRRVKLEMDVETRDRFGRLLAYVWLEDDGEVTMVNEVLLRKGYAMIFTIPPNLRHDHLLRKAFMDAREAREGLWKRASGRVFSPAQVWAELPSLAGRFVILRITVKSISESSRRYTLNPVEGNSAMVIYKSDSRLFGPISGFKGKTLKVVGKIIAGFSGGEIILADPAQIISVE